MKIIRSSAFFWQSYTSFGCKFQHFLVKENGENKGSQRRQNHKNKNIKKKTFFEPAPANASSTTLTPITTKSSSASASVSVSASVSATVSLSTTMDRVSMQNRCGYCGCAARRACDAACRRVCPYEPLSPLLVRPVLQIVLVDITLYLHIV